MPIFIKTEKFKVNSLSNNFKKAIIKEHRYWVESLKETGIRIKSGYLIDNLQKPGGGGLLIIECRTYKEARKILINDPMIKHEIVDWELHQWIDIHSKLRFNS